MKAIHLLIKNKIIAAAILVVFAAGTIIIVSGASADMHMKGQGQAMYNDKGELLVPKDFRKWIFAGAPLTPNPLNGGSAAFPEFHYTYIAPGAYAQYQKTGKFPEGTVIAKELVLLQKGDHKDGSKNASSGRGFFADQYNGLDVMVKNSKRYAKSHGWGFFNFGHNAPPYAASAAVQPAQNCAPCHKAGAAKDMLFTQYYLILR